MTLLSWFFDLTVAMIAGAIPWAKQPFIIDASTERSDGFLHLMTMPFKAQSIRALANMPLHVIEHHTLVALNQQLMHL